MNLVNVQVLDQHHNQFDCHIHDRSHHLMEVLMEIEVIEFEFEAKQDNEMSLIEYESEIYL